MFVLGRKKFFFGLLLLVTVTPSSFVLGNKDEKTGEKALLCNLPGDVWTLVLEQCDGRTLRALDACAHLSPWRVSFRSDAYLRGVLATLKKTCVLTPQRMQNAMHYPSRIRQVLCGCLPRVGKSFSKNLFKLKTFFILKGFDLENCRTKQYFWDFLNVAKPQVLVFQNCRNLNTKFLGRLARFFRQQLPVGPAAEFSARMPGIGVWMELESKKTLIIDGVSWKNIFGSSKMPECVQRILIAQELGNILAEGVLDQIFVGVTSLHPHTPAHLDLDLPQWRFRFPNNGGLRIYSTLEFNLAQWQTALDQFAVTRF